MNGISIFSFREKKIDENNWKAPRKLLMTMKKGLTGLYICILSVYDFVE